jgi:hypothetical protein
MKEVLMDKTHVRFWHTFSDVTVLNRKKKLFITNKFRQTGLLVERELLNHNTKYSLK